MLDLPRKVFNIIPAGYGILKPLAAALSPQMGNLYGYFGILSGLWAASCEYCAMVFSIIKNWKKTREAVDINFLHEIILIFFKKMAFAG